MHVRVSEVPAKLRSMLHAIDRGEHVVIPSRGKPRATLIPSGQVPNKPDFKKHPACGMWADREDMADPVAWVRAQRRSWRRY